MFYDRRVMLKIKAASLAEEARIIRRMEKHRRRLREQLYRHRIDTVRAEARATQIAFTFLRGKPFNETNSITQPDWDAVRRMVAKYGVYEASEDEEMRVDQALNKSLELVKGWTYTACELIKANRAAYIEAQPTREADNKRRKANHKSRPLAEWMAMA